MCQRNSCISGPLVLQRLNLDIAEREETAGVRNFMSVYSHDDMSTDAFAQSLYVTCSEKRTGAHALNVLDSLFTTTA